MTNNNIQDLRGFSSSDTYEFRFSYTQICEIKMALETTFEDMDIEDGVLQLTACELITIASNNTEGVKIVKQKVDDFNEEYQENNVVLTIEVRDQDNTYTFTIDSIEDYHDQATYRFCKTK